MGVFVSVSSFVLSKPAELHRDERFFSGVCICVKMVTLRC